MDNNSNSEVKAQTPLALPAPDTVASSDPQSSTRTLDVNGSGRIALDELGPMVVNSDGTLSRIANWAQMTEAERQRTLRVLSARNKLRLANEEKKQREGGASETPDAAQGSEEALSILKDAESSSSPSGQPPRPTAY